MNGAPSPATMPAVTRRVADTKDNVIAIVADAVGVVVVTGKAIAAAAGVPFIAVNHLEGHALSARLSHGIEFPFLLLLVTGGHCQLIAAEALGRYQRLGTTIDDALGRYCSVRSRIRR